MTTTLTFTITIQAAPATVREALTRDTLVWQWLSDTALLQDGGGSAFLFVWNSGWRSTGTYTVVGDERVALTWRGSHDPGETAVEFQLTALDGGTQVHLTHTGIGGGLDWQPVIAELNKAWPFALECLQYLCEHGHDLRRVRRPYFGMFVQPDPAGIKLMGVSPEGTLGQAGLTSGDIITHLNDHGVATLAEVMRVADSLRAGQTIPVTFLRAGVTHRVDAVLQPRPKPDIPPTVAALLEVVKHENETDMAALATLVSGVSEADLARRPAPGTWSVNENLAHLIWAERWTHMYLWGLLSGEHAVRWPDNDDIQRAGTLAAYPTNTDLRAALARDHEATYGQLALLESMPDVVRAVPKWVLIAETAIDMRDHTKEHLKQMGNALQALRGGAS